MKNKDLSTIESKNEEISRTLYVRLKKTIKSENDVKHFFDEYERFIIHRKKSRNCYVVFKDKETQQHYLEKLKSVENVFVSPRTPLDPKKVEERMNINKKKIKTYRKYKENPVFDDYILMAKNIPIEVTAAELKSAFSGCKSVHIYDTNSPKTKRAKLKMESPAITKEYIDKKRELPIFNGKRVQIITLSFLSKKKKEKVRRTKKEKLES